MTARSRAPSDVERRIELLRLIQRGQASGIGCPKVLGSKLANWPGFVGNPCLAYGQVLVFGSCDSGWGTLAPVCCGRKPPPRRGQSQFLFRVITIRMNFRVDLDTYRGPLDLLLYLVRKHEVDVADIPIALITRQYLEHLEILEALDVDAVGDFLGDGKHAGRNQVAA